MQTDVDAELATRLTLALGRLNRRLVAGGQGLSHGVLSALSSIVRFGPLRLSDLAQRERIGAPATSRIVARLEADKLVSRDDDPDDGRAVVIAATQAGRELVHRSRTARTEVIAELLQSLDAGQLDTLRLALPSLEAMVDAP
ncbi:MarR family winged helix-turn-helix transcriptional regulator [Parafrigoribacterium humi]|jgi:DNA-binding MarR family transcriptional regulator|uniref:MarR family winged helix-turn-helix transcriptional regulator n=1 Tax=Parafrigoribacterium humi TaxID=3144664 RepID=UPI0032F0355D